MMAVGRLSMTYHPRSSKAAEAVDRPAPDIPVTMRTRCTPSVLPITPADTSGLVWGTVVGIWVQLGEERCRHSFWEPRQCSEVFT